MMPLPKTKVGRRPNELLAFAGPRGVLAACLAGWAILTTPASLAVAAQSAAAAADVRRDATVEAVERVLPSVVNIATATIVRLEDYWMRFFDSFYRSRPPGSVGYSVGSGVIIDEEGYLLSNSHVVERADKIWIKPCTSTNTYEAELVAVDRRRDIALLKIKAPAEEKFPAIPFAPDDDLLLGETVLALGNPFGLGGSVSRGILSSKTRVSPTEDDRLEVPNWLQTDAAINPGNSGGPLVNLRGELIGLNVAVLQGGQGIGFAIPARYVADALSRMLTPELAKRLWFGALVRAGAGALVIKAVQPESPAEKAGLKVDDVIAEVNGKSPKGFIHFNELLLANTQKPIALRVRRGGETRTVSVKMIPESAFFNAELIRKKTGLTLEEMTPQRVAAFGTQTGGGFVVAEVDARSGAARVVERGYVITAIERHRPEDLVEAAKLIYDKAPGDNLVLEVMVRQQRMNFVSYRRGLVEIPVR